MKEFSALRKRIAVEWLPLSAKLRLREFVRVMGGADIPASMSQIRSVWRTFKNAAPGKIVRSTAQGSSFGPRGMVVQKAAGAKIDREALLAGATNTTNYPITSALHEGGHALFNKAMTGSATQQFLPRLPKGPTPELHPLRGVQIMANEIGANNSAVQVLRGAGVKQDAVSDFMKFRQRGIDSHMRSARDHVAAAPVGLTPQRHQEIKGAFNRWITDWKRSPASPNAKLSVDAPELVKKDFEAAKLRLRELATVEWTPQAKAVWRHYFKKAKKQMRGGRFGDMDGYLPDDRNRSPFGLMWRGANKGEVEKLGTEGRFVSNWSHFSKPGAKRTYVAGSPNMPEGYALTAAAYSDRGALQAARMGHHTDAVSEGFEKARIYGIAPSALKRSDNKIRSHIGSYASTAPLRGGIGAKEVRVLLKPTGKRGDSVRWRPAPLGEVMRRDFESAKLRLRELARGDYAIPALGKMLKDRSFLEQFLTGKRGPKLGDLMASKVGNGLRSAPIRVKGPLDWDNKFVMEGITHSIKNPASTAAREGIAMGLKARDLRVREIYPAGRQQARDTIAKMIRKGRAGGDVYEAGGIYPEYGFSAKLRLWEFALGAGTRIRHIPLNERKAVAERLRKLIGEDSPALMGRVPPRMIRADNKDFILHYRGSGRLSSLKRPKYRHRTNEGMASYDPWGEGTRRMNAKEKQGFLQEAVAKRDREDWAMYNTIGTSTNPHIAQHFRNLKTGAGEGFVGVYATPIEGIPKRIQEGKIGFPGRGDWRRNTWEQEISQPNGGNLVKVRKYKTIDDDELPVKTVRGASISKRIRDFSAKLRLREAASKPGTPSPK